jgi:hypothetical protein
LPLFKDFGNAQSSTTRAATIQTEGRRYAPACRSGWRYAGSPSIEGVLDAPNDWLGSAILQPQTQLGAVVGLVADQAFRCFAYGDEPLRGRAVMRFAAPTGPARRPSQIRVRLRASPNSLDSE